MTGETPERIARAVFAYRKLFPMGNTDECAAWVSDFLYDRVTEAEVDRVWNAMREAKRAEVAA